MPPAPAYGLAYTPATIPRLRAPAIDDLPVGVRFVRIQWTDLTNITRCRVVPLPAFRALLQSSRPGVAITVAALGILGAGLAEGFSGTGEYVLVPEMDTLRVCAYAPGHASVVGYFQLKEPEPGRSLAVPLCPRTLLRRIEEDARAAGIEYLVGVETEFILLSGTEPMTGTSTAPWSSTAGLYTGTISATVLEEITNDLQRSGIEVLMYHAEAAPGQFEIVTGPLPPLQAADAVVLTRETIYNVASKHGLRATFAPRIFSDSPGSAAHTNISLHRTPGSPILESSPDATSAAPFLTAPERSFLQAVLTHLPALAAFTLPTHASYARVKDGVWSGGTYASWGRDNREAAIRVTGSAGARRFEIRTVDGTASPHVALAALLGAGTRGVRDGAELQIKEVLVGAAELSDAERAERGIVARLPASAELARQNLLQDTVVREILGEEFVGKYVKVNEALQKFMAADGPDEEMKKLVEMY